MKSNSINPVKIVHAHFTELYEKYTTTSDPQEKIVLNKRLSNLESVLKFLASMQSYSKKMGNYA